GGGAIEHFPQWTSDGRIVFLSERITDNRDPVSDVWIMDADGSNAGLLFDAIPHGGPLEFLAESSTVVFHSPRSGNFDIYTTVLGQQSTVVTPRAQVTVESFGPAGSQPTATAAEAVAAAPQPTTPAAATAPGAGPAGIGLGVVGLALLAGGGVVYFLLRRGRAA
ncbi:MAG: hypothetical protein IT318_05620, partial [Anaerolineales bacterium]|nr:hypothetical protein [Anaerolineales bacterium]